MKEVLNRWLTSDLIRDIIRLMLLVLAGFLADFAQNLNASLWPA